MFHVNRERLTAPNLYTYTHCRSNAFAKALSAMGRAYFLAEGCEEKQVFELAWLIEAAKHDLAPAIERVNVFKESDAELYHDALAINQALTKKQHLPLYTI